MVKQTQSQTPSPCPHCQTTSFSSALPTTQFFHNTYREGGGSRLKSLVPPSLRFPSTYCQPGEYRGRGEERLCPAKGQASFQPYKIDAVPISLKPVLKDFSKANTWPLADNSPGPNWQLLIVRFHVFWTGRFHARSSVGSGLGLRAGSGWGLVISDCSVMPPADSRATVASVSKVLSRSPAFNFSAIYINGIIQRISLIFWFRGQGQIQVTNPEWTQ